jgi:hypothetical protein
LGLPSFKEGQQFFSKRSSLKSESIALGQLRALWGDCIYLWMQIEKVCFSPNLSKQDRDHKVNETLIAGHPEAKMPEKIDGLLADGNGTSHHAWCQGAFDWRLPQSANMDPSI